MEFYTRKELVAILSGEMRPDKHKQWMHDAALMLEKDAMTIADLRNRNNGLHVRIKELSEELISARRYDS